MFFGLETLHLKRIENHIWEREPLNGNLVIVVIDDECGYALQDSDKVLDPQLAILPLLRELVCKWRETLAIGFFRLMGTKENADKILVLIHEWLERIKTPDTRVYFLVDVLYDGRIGVASNHTIERLTTLYSYPQDHIAYLTRAGASVPLPSTYALFGKAQQADHARQNGTFHPDLMSFFGKSRHENGSINEAIRFYATPWDVGWEGEGWEHDSLEEPDSQQLQALSEWLNVPVDELIFNRTDKTDSAKSLMIWHEDDLWQEENPPWKARDRRQIKGKVLNAVLKKLEIPLASPIPDESSITMPCVPCFPFLVSLRSFLWRCEKEEDEIVVDKICFFQLGQNPQVNMFHLLLPLKDPFMLTKKFFGIGEERIGVFTRGLRDVPHCRTDKLMGAEGEDYIRLFTDGTELPVVAVEIAPNQINFIWSVR